MKDVIDFIDEFEIPDFGDIADCFKVLVTESHRIVRNQTAPIIDELTKFVNSDLPNEVKMQQLVDGFLTPEFNDQMKSIYTALAFTEAILPSNYKISKKGSINFFDYTPDGRKITTYRFDKPHPGYDYEHLNMNLEYFNQPDPHIWLPPGTTTCMWICLIPVELLLWITRKCKTVLISAMALRSIANDLRFGTTRNCAETAVYAVGVTVSLFITAKIGAVAFLFFGGGLLFFVPPIVTLYSGYRLYRWPDKISNFFKSEFDHMDYDIDNFVCRNCYERVKLRRYLGESHTCSRKGLWY